MTAEDLRELLRAAETLNLASLARIHELEEHVKVVEQANIPLVEAARELKEAREETNETMTWERMDNAWAAFYVALAQTPGSKRPA